MATYHIFKDWIIRREDNWKQGEPQAFIPSSEDNLEYRMYLKWVAKGNKAKADSGLTLPDD